MWLWGGGGGILGGIHVLHAFALIVRTTYLQRDTVVRHFHPGTVPEDVRGRNGEETLSVQRLLPAYGRNAVDGVVPGCQVLLLDASCVVEGRKARSLPLCRLAPHSHEYLRPEALQGARATD